MINFAVFFFLLFPISGHVSLMSKVLLRPFTDNNRFASDNARTVRSPTYPPPRTHLDVGYLQLGVIQNNQISVNMHILRHQYLQCNLLRTLLQCTIRFSLRN